MEIVVLVVVIGILFLIGRNYKTEEFKNINYDEVKHQEKIKQFDEVQKEKDALITVINELKVKIATITGQIKTIEEALKNNEIQL